MKKILLSLLLSALMLSVKSQSFKSADTINAPANLQNIYSRQLYSDSLASSFVIFIKKEVKAHKHISHTEHVYILDGEGEMLLNDKKIKVKKGDIIFIPKNTIHSLKTTSLFPMKVISIQSPMFDGKDRIFIEN